MRLFPIITLVLFCLSAVNTYALNIVIIESQSFNAGHTMDSKWLTVATGMGHTAGIMPQTTLDNNTFFTTTDILIVSSGVISLPPNRVNTIQQFIQQGGDVYLQSEYDCSTFTTNAAFASIVNALGGNFSWQGIVSGILAPMNVLGSISSTNNAVSSLACFWYGCRGTTICGGHIEPFMEYLGDYFGFIFCPPNASYGRLITSSDQDWILNNVCINTNWQQLMENIITNLSNPNYFCASTGSGPTVTISSQTNILCNGQCTGSSIVTVSGGNSPYTYLWSNGQTTTNATALCAGTHTITVTDANGCITTQTVTIIQPTALTATVTSTSATCSNNNGTVTVTAIGGTPGYTYSWNPTGQTTGTATGLSAGTYTATVTDANGCTTTQTVTVVSSGSATTMSQSASICSGSAYTLPGGTVVNTGGTYIDTLTSVAGCDSIITTALTVNPIFTASQSASICSGFAYTLPGGTVVSTGGTYIDTLTSVAGCDSIITTTLTVNPVFTASQSASICSGSAYILPGGTVVSTSGTYMDTLIAVGGCDSIITTTLTVNPNPTATAFSNVTITQGQSVTLTASGGGTYSWSNGATGATATAAPAFTTIYCVKVTDTNNCTDTACITITVEQIDCSTAGELYLPNAFSPNGDGENDELKIYYGDIRCIESIKLVIYNRWGEKVFSATGGETIEWDGTYRGKKMYAAVFVWYLNVFFTDGTEVNKKGNVSLIR